MLKGWVLTDRICPKCSKVPLMRSPPSAAVEVHFCVNCDPAPSTGSSANAASTHPSRIAAVPKPSAPQDVHSISSTSNSSGMSRSSTPPTEVSRAPESPPLVPIMDTAELMRRRHQSDTASAEIGNRMLRGWAMLADECPNPQCYGIPLVRPPKTGTTIDPRKECVICGIVYVDETDAFGQERLVPMHPARPSPAATSRAPIPEVVAPTLASTASLEKGKARAYPEKPTQPQVPSARERDLKAATALPHSSTSSALEASARSLEMSLVALSERLNAYTTAPFIDPTPIGQTADAMSKVSQALTQVKQLLWSESQALLN
ncbi:hypothetical protein L226DRAFT_535337 [Lentinus tigrinus ALCF2SS1-7]|uniref:Sjogrens syndrome scleroderma autoantigen 1 family protein n=1 Tax=Lentinus tigrinus ALCF2SS1-6 TaxID=1328759 RepID=A0A5C2SDZ3_9APHY|nr:hypothetical protein L227DRAFT_573830 [Lentinus tigrinus ALCF2SS1-6]RPD74458.1 hypothetical protein L226DRAFT_535337 [Lentinus tigrinus ALCF2SS1-7]